MEKEFDSCDGALWHVVQNEHSAEVDSTVYNYNDRFVQPTFGM